MRNEKANLLVALMCAVVASASAGRAVSADLPAEDQTVGMIAPAFKATDTDGRAIAFPGSYKGKVVLLDFWATWCAPCVAEMPWLVQAHKEFRAKGVEFLGVSLDEPDSADTLKAIAANQGVTWPQIYDGKAWKGDIAAIYGIRLIPAPFLVDGDTGQILAAGRSLRGPALIPTIREALKQKEENSRRRLAPGARVEPKPFAPPNEPAFENEPGWVWHVKPFRAEWATAGGPGVQMQLDELKDDKLRLTLAHTVESAREVVRFRPIAIDDAGRRSEFRFDHGGTSGNVALQGYLLDLKKTPRSRVTYIGVEKLTKDNLRAEVAPAAFRQLREAGKDALPFAETGKRYEFEVTALDGRKLRSHDFHGKVVLLVFWARWCGPCMTEIPKLKKVYRDWHGQGLEVIGLNHDYSRDVATRVIGEQNLPWPNVLAPVDEVSRDLWEKASGATALPRMLLIDREGILRKEVSAFDLDAEIRRILTVPGD